MTQFDAREQSQSREEKLSRACLLSHARLTRVLAERLLSRLFDRILRHHTVKLHIENWETIIVNSGFFIIYLFIHLFIYY